MFSILRYAAAMLCAFVSVPGCDDRSQRSVDEAHERADDPAMRPPAVVYEDAATVGGGAVTQPVPRKTPPTTPARPPVVNQPANPAMNQAATPWPRKMAVDPATGYVISPAAKVKHPPRIIAWYPIGNSDSTPGNRRIGWNIKKDGWAGFINTWVEPALKLGFDAVQLHNPGGTREHEEMQPDQFLDAKDDGIDWISRGFVDAWRPVTQRVQVIAYLGMLPKNERFEGLLQRGDRAGFLQALTDSYKLPLEARMDIAFDALHMVKNDGWELQVFRLFTAMGVKTYIEPIPNVIDKSLFDANFEVMNRTLERALSNGEAWVPAMDQLTGERIVLLAEPPSGKEWKTQNEWLPGYLRHWTSQGWSIAMNPEYCMKSGIGPRDLLSPPGSSGVK